ncbi:MAG: biopolymer transporter ExbD [Gemmatimonadaceae bacterium]|nr:biopolymer transporter ExbD [Gemmatimonadaceae bacterium]
MRSVSIPGLTREPNVVPMIDVLLVLLVIFMIAQVAVRKEFPLQLPQDEGTSASEPSLVLSVEAGPRYVLNGIDIAPGELTARLQQVVRDRPRKILFVRGAPTVRYQDVVTAFDAARGAGVHVTGVVPRRP